MDLDALCARCLQGDTAGAVTPSMAYTYVKSPFSLWCEFHGPEKARDPKNRFQDLIFAEGARHEDRIVRRLYPDVEPLDVDDPEEGFRRALDFMAGGGQALHGAPLFFLPEGLYGVIDVVERVDTGTSAFGDFSYVVKEIKSAKNISGQHRLQAAISNYLLGRIQRHTPETYFVIDRDGTVHDYAYDEAEVTAVMEEIRELQNGGSVDPVYGSGVWPWETYNDEAAIEANDVSLICGVGSALREKLRSGGLRTVRDVAEASPDELQEIHGIGPAKGSGLVAAARALEDDAHVQVNDVVLPRCVTEVFFDLEGTAQQSMDGEVVDMDYMIGALVRQGEHEHFRAFVAHDVDGEGKMFRDFMEWVLELESPHLFHWHHYENWRLERMSRRYGMREEVETLLSDRTVDLHQVATEAFVFPTYSNSIKDVAPYMGFEWQHDDVSATESIVMYFEYLQDPDETQHLLDKIIGYNRDDCVATRVVKDWLSERCR